MGKDVGGFDKVYYLTFYSEKPNFKEREHPLSEYFYEVVVGKLTEKSSKTNYKLEKKMKVIGVWLSSDGDDTESNFDIIVEEIIFN